METPSVTICIKELQSIEITAQTIMTLVLRSTPFPFNRKLQNTKHKSTAGQNKFDIVTLIQQEA